MRNSIYRITLDLHHDASQVQIKAKQNDVARRLYVTLTDQGKPYFIEKGCSAVMMIKKPDATILINDCDIDLTGSAIIYDFTAQTVASTGICECEVRVYGTNNELLTSARFTMLVSSTVYQDGQVQSQSEFNTLTNALTAVNTVDVDVTKVGDTATITLTKPSGTEVSASIKDGEDGVSPTASVTKSGDQVTITITDATGTTTTTILDGATAAETAATKASEASASADNASGYATTALGYKNDALGYKNDALGYKNEAGNSASSAATETLKSEGYALGTQNGTPVSEGSPYYQNNAKHYGSKSVLTVPQTLTDAEKAQARSNMGVGSGTGDMIASVYDPTNKSQDIFAYADGKVSTHNSANDAHSSMFGGKVDKVNGKGLSTNDYDATEKQKVADAYNNKHSHSNKSLLDTYDQTNANLTDAVSKKHEHKKTTLSLPTASWVGSASPYSQTITITGSTANTKVDLQTDDTVITQLIEDGCIALYVENNNGTLTVKAVGEKPSANISVQAVYSEVAV